MVEPMKDANGQYIMKTPEQVRADARRVKRMTTEDLIRREVRECVLRHNVDSAASWVRVLQGFTSAPVNGQAMVK